MALANWSRKSLVFAPLMVLLLFLVACGASAPETAATQPAAEPVAAQSEPAAPAEPEVVIAPAATAQAQPTPTPLPAKIIYQGK